MKNGIVFLGDSICAGLCYEKESCKAENYFSNPIEIKQASEKCWKNHGGWAFQYALYHPEENVYNYAVSGGALGNFIRGDNNSIPSEYESFKSDFPVAEIHSFVIEASLNDLYCKYLHQIVVEESVSSLERLIKKIKTEYSAAKIYVIIAPERFDELYEIKIKKEIEAYISDIKDLCKNLNVPAIDLFHDSNFKCSLDNGKSWPIQFFNHNEGVHPSLLAQQKILYPFIEKVI